MEFGPNGAVVQPQNPQDTTLPKSPPKSPHAYEGGPRSLVTLSKWAVIGLIGYMIACFVFVLISVFLIWLYLPSTVVPFTQAQLQAADTVIINAGFALMAIFWFCVFFVGRVTFRAMKNLHTIESKFPEMSPAWSVGWYFVPFANLWQPAKGMSQIYQGTFHAVGDAPPAGGHLAFWWTCWLIANFVSNLAFRIGNFDNSGFSTTSFSIDAISYVFGILSAWGLIRLIKPIAERQELLKHGGVAQVFD